MEEKKTKEQDFIVETPIFIEEKLGKNTDKVRKYERGKFLGKGGFAKCYEMKCIDTNKIYAAKVFEKKALSNARSKKKLINEIKLHKKLHHQNIVNFEHFFEDKDNVYILLELCTNQTLNEILKRRKRLTEIEVQCYLIQIIKALKYIHNHKIIHRDLKLGNCFITGKLELKLGDFGLAAKLEYEGQRRRTVCGTPNYIAPEILEKKNGHSFEVDIWSLGVVAYTLLFGRPPYETSDVKLTYKKIKMNNYTFPENIKVHPSAKRLISSILNLDPSKRPSLDTILEHEFFRLYNSVPVVLPLSSLACPPSSKYISQFTTNEGNYLQSNNLPNSNLNNTFNNLQYRLGVNSDINNALNSNMNSAENLALNNNMSKDIINRLLQGSDNLFHRRSESLTNFNDEQFLEKVNQILHKANNNNNGAYSNGSRNNMKNDPGNLKFLSSDKGSHASRGTKEQLNQQNSDYGLNNQNVINNNFFINVGNLNNMELKFDNIDKTPLAELLASGILTTQNPKRLFMNKITNFYDHTHKFGIVYFVNNTHIGICFNDNTNILKNIRLDSNDHNKQLTGTENNSGVNTNGILNNKSLQYLYIEKDGKGTLNYDETGFENCLQNSNKTGSKDLLKKFEIFKHILNKHTKEILTLEDSPVNNTILNLNHQNMFYLKKFLKVQHATMFRLSNKLIQVIFSDKAEIILSTQANDFYYKGKDGSEVWDSLQNMMNLGNEDMIKRIKYAKSMLIHFVKNNKSKKIPK